MSDHVPVTAKQVAELAGVSRAAVSRSFTPGASVSPETRRKVMAAAEALGYQVNHLARGLISAQSGLVALIAAEIETPYRASLLSALSQALQSAGKTPILIATDRSDESVKEALHKARSYRTEAAVMFSGMPDTALADLCLRNGMRLVLINRDETREGTLQIRLDDRQAGRSAFNLLAKTGCRRMGLVSSSAGTPSLTGRIEGFREAAREAGAALGEWVAGETGYETGLQAGTELFARPDAPDGVFCVTDLLAMGVMDAARHRLGLQVPRDAAIIGFDNIPQAGWESYRLTTFDQPIDEIAVATVDWLAAPAEPGMPGETVCLPARLVWRDTVRRPLEPGRD
ncbi:LacI family DNA-binding transcriptional regulator [Poseidonocella sp. HB161398]|uniref:LacI family DNA-binding transcriptional regulator n=1 Tax=Poseidonocella sp. HB161398 TaxID=2320855 RepID=UPI001109D38A|nr:LacI family DNA-binding transcriptional regulator [Poseidonocella sp. HB161398]